MRPMGKLSDIMLKDGTRDRVISDSVRLIDEEVADRRGISGLAIKGGYKIIKRVKKGFVQEAVDGLIDEFIEKLEPYLEEHEGSGGSGSFAGFMTSNKTRVADSLLGVTDQRRDGSTNKTIRKAYDKLRPMAKSNVEQAVPRLGTMVQKYLDQSS